MIKVENNTPSLAYISKKMNNPELAVTLVKLHLLELVDFFNISRSMTMNQIELTSELVVETYPTMKIADMVYTFKQAMTGKFGALYESLDGAKVLSWFEQVLSERADAGEQISLSEHGKNKQEIIQMVGNDRKSGLDELKELVHNSVAKNMLGQLDRKEPLTE